jgi:hypothetical protein
MNAFGAPFILEGLFSEADAEPMDADPDPKLAADNMGMDVEGDRDGGMIADDDTLCVMHPSPTLFPAVKQ